MDFGFGDVLEQMEQRIGSWAVTCVLACILLGALFWVIDGIVVIAGNIEGYIADKHPIYSLLRIAFGIGFMLIVGWIGLTYMGRKAQRKILENASKHRAKLDQYATEISEQAQKNIEECKATHRICEEWMERIEKMSKDGAEDRN